MASIEKPQAVMREADVNPKEREIFEKAKREATLRIRQELESRGCPELLRGRWETVLVLRAALDAVNRSRVVAHFRSEISAWELASRRGWAEVDYLANRSQ